MALGTAAAIGAQVGAGLLSDIFKKKPKIRQINTRSPEQIARSSQFGQMGMDQYKDPYSGFEPIKQQAQNNFYSNTVPTIAERFSSLGSGGSQNSSAFAGQLGAAGVDLNSELAALQSQHGFRNRDQALQLLGMSQEPNFENYVEGGGNGGALSSAFSGLQQGAGAFQQYQMQKDSMRGPRGAMQQAAPSAVDEVRKLQTQKVRGNLTRDDMQPAENLTQQQAIGRYGEYNGPSNRGEPERTSNPFRGNYASRFLRNFGNPGYSSSY